MQGRVLVVEDNPDWRKKFVKILEKEGYSVRQAPNYDKAASLVQKQLFDVVVLDLRLVAWDDTDFRGMDLLDEIEKFKGEQGTNVIIVTGYGKVEHAREAFKKYHVFDFLQKGLKEGKAFNIREFKETVRGAAKDAYAKRGVLL